jgi:hypothetical protein
VVVVVVVVVAEIIIAIVFVARVALVVGVCGHTKPRTRDCVRAKTLNKP